MHVHVETHALRRQKGNIVNIKFFGGLSQNKLGLAGGAVQYPEKHSGSCVWEEEKGRELADHTHC